MKREIIIDYTAKDETGRHQFIFILWQFSERVRLFDCSLKMDLWKHPKVRTLLRLVLNSENTGGKLDVFFQCLITHIKRIDNIELFYFPPQMLNKETGELKYELFMPYEMTDELPKTKLVFEPAEPITVRPGVNMIELDQSSLPGRKVFSIMRFNVFQPKILYNRSVFEAKAFLLIGNQTEKIYVYCFFDIGKLIKAQWIRSKGMDGEMARLVYLAFYNSYLKVRFRLSLRNFIC
jgi:hypothetical protein